MRSTPKLRVLAGPNGSGKSTLLDYLSELSHSQGFPLGFVLNPDEVEYELVRHHRLQLRAWGVRTDEAAIREFVEAHPLRPQLNLPLPRVERGTLVHDDGGGLGYYIPVLCDFLRTRWLKARESFTFETVFSAEAKLALLRDAGAYGYRMYLYYICTDDVHINRERIQIRVAGGGHSVPDDIIASRFEKSLSLLPEAISLTHRAYLFDNSGTEHEMVAEFENGNLVKRSRSLPAWVERSGLKVR